MVLLESRYQVIKAQSFTHRNCLVKNRKLIKDFSKEMNVSLQFDAKSLIKL
jgi:hypothetical protein